MLENLTRDAFAEQLNTKFNVYFTPEKTSAAELIDVSELKKHSRQEVFSLLFLAPLDLPIEQRIYRMQHDVLGDLELFLAPVERTADGIKYESVFNRLTD